MNRSVTATLFAIVLIAVGDAAAQNLSLKLVTGGLSGPVFVTSAPGDSNRLFIVEQGSGGPVQGTIRIFDRTTNTLSATPYLSVPVSGGTGTERGLLGLAFHPSFSTNGRFYVNYTAPSNGNLTVAEYTANGTPLTSTSANPTGTTLLSTAHSASNHNGGWMGFRPGTSDLYIAAGDSGSSNDPGNVAQNINSRLGKLLRIEVTTPGNFVAPATNPFAGATPGDDLIWAYGLRNPWRNSFDRANGNLWIADVGQNAFEEINFEPASSPGGVNYGWRSKEGFAITGLDGSGPFTGLTDPVHTYAHIIGSRSITGGYVYRGDDIPSLNGQYLFGDYISGRIWSLPATGAVTPTATELTAQLARPGGGNFRFDISSFGEDADGELYLVAYDGFLYQIVPEPGTFALLAMGWLWLFGRRRRTRSA